MALFKPRPGEEEDRPPIIVKGGSLVIQSGHDGGPSRPWEEFQGGYRQRQPDGADLETFSVRYSGPHPSCTATFGRAVRVTYKSSMHQAVVVVIARARDPVSGKHEPFVTAQRRFRIDNGSANSRLVLDERGSIESIAVGREVCRIPDQAILESIGSGRAPRKGRKIGFVAVGAAMVALTVWAWRSLRRNTEESL